LGGKKLNKLFMASAPPILQPYSRRETTEAACNNALASAFRKEVRSEEVRINNNVTEDNMASTRFWLHLEGWLVIG
jgi:hypothetical protein